MSLPKSGADSDDESHEHLPPSKNGAGLLNDLVSQAGLQFSCEWDFVGTASLPAFSCRLTIGSAVYTGAGSSKKSSKHSAAKAAVNALWPDHAVTDEPPTKEVLTPDGQNPITVLQILVERRRLSLPEYVVIEERPVVGRGAAYTMGCQVGSLMEKGSGPCKRTAKREAALRMLEKLKGEEKPVPDHSANPVNTAPGRVKSTSVRVSPYPRPTRPFPENPSGGIAHSFNTTPGKNGPYTLRPALPNTGPIRPLVELRQDRSAQEMHRGYDVQGALNTGTTRPPKGNQSCHSTQEFNRGPIDHAQHPLIQQINRVPIAHAQNPLEPVTPSTVPIRPPMELRFDRSAPEMHSVLGHNTQHPWTPGPLNTATVRPLMENHQRAQELGGNARFSLKPASLSSGMVRVLLPSQQDLGAQGLNSTEGCEEEYIWARVSKITGMATLFLEQKADLKSEKMNKGPERRYMRGTFVTLKPAGTLERPLGELEGPSSERNAAPGTNASCTLSSTNLIPPGPHLDDRQNMHGQGFTISQENNAEYPLTFGKNAGATRAQFSLSHPGSFQTTLENRRHSNFQELNSTPGKYVGNRVRWALSFSGMPPGHF